MSLLDRMRRFWLPGFGSGHPLTERGAEPRPETAVAEVSSLAERFIGEPFDSDAATDPP